MLITCLAATTWASVEQNQSLESITAAAVAASQQQAQKLGYQKVSVEVRPLDNRLRLPQCDKPLSSFTPGRSEALGAVSVGVRCTGQKPWTIYVRTHISAQQTVPVLARSLPRHSLITENDLKLVDQPLTPSNKDIVYDPRQIIGMELTRPLNQGSVVRASQLRPAKVVTRGQQVTLLSGVDGLEVRMQGKALRDATAGERVQVTNLSSGQQVEGIANTDGSVSVP